MQRKAQLFASLILVLYVAQYVRTQQPTQQPSPAPVRPSASSLVKKREKDRTQGVQEILTLSNRVLRFQEPELKIKTIIFLADIVWSKGNDGGSARQLFLKADELIRSVQMRKDTERGSVSSLRDDSNSNLTASVVRNLKKLLIQKLSRYDAPLAQRLSQEYGVTAENTAGFTYSDNIEAARDSLRNGDRSSALRYIERSIQANPSGRRDLLNLLSLLFTLRTKDTPAADELFIRTTLRLSSQPGAEADDVLILGNYLFASRNLAPRLLSIPQVMISPTWVGDILVQADVSVARPGISIPTVRAYIGAATEALSRASSDPEERMRKYAAAYLLLPQAQRFTPEFVSQLSAIQPPGSIASSVGNQEGPMLRLGTDNDKFDLDAWLQKIERMANDKKRDQYLLQAVKVLYLKENHDAARIVADKIQDQSARNKLVNLINFRQAAKALEHGQPEIAEQSLTTLSSSSERNLLKLGLAQLYLKKQDKVAAEIAINAVISDLRANDYSASQPYLILTALEMLAFIDSTVATSRLRDAVQAFNAIDPTSRRQSQHRFEATVTIGDSSVVFPLNVGGVKYGDLHSTLKSLAASPQAVRAAILELKDESVLSEGIIAYANMRLS